MRQLLRDAIRASLRPAESWTLRGADEVPFPPVFIISPPRSGSTLLYLLAAQKFHLSYFSNFSMSCPESPGFLTRLGAPFGACAGSATLDNHFGETTGWNAPNQGYRAWNRWFPTDRDYLDPDEIPPDARRQIRRTIGAIEKATGSPFINKWQRNATRVRALDAVFPEAVFLQLRRDPLFTVQSVLLARRKFLGSGDGWFSAMPRSYVPDPGKSQLRQAAEQVALLEKDLKEDKKLVGEGRFWVLDYHELCRDADAALDAFASWYASRTGVHLRRRRDLNAQLAENTSIRITGDEVAEIRAVFETLGYAR